MTPEHEYLHAIRAYLHDRGLTGFIYTPETTDDYYGMRGLGLGPSPPVYDPANSYLEIRRGWHLITITINDCVARAKTIKLCPPQKPRSDVEQFDLLHPDSLQKIFEYAISKKRK